MFCDTKHGKMEHKMSCIANTLNNNILPAKPLKRHIHVLQIKNHPNTPVKKRQNLITLQTENDIRQKHHGKEETTINRT